MTSVLHLYDSPPTGGATVAAEAVARCVGGDEMLIGKPTRWQQAFRTVGGYCSICVMAQMRMALAEHKPDIVHLHNFKEAGTAAIVQCKSVRVPVVAHIYDYWCFSPRDNETAFSWHTYQPAKGRRWPLLAKLPLLGRRRRIMRWMNRLDAVIALSEDSKRRLRDGGLTRPPIHVVPLPVTVPLLDDHSFHSEFGLWPGERDPNLVLFVGGPAPNKGKHVFDAAMKIVQAKRPEVVGKSMFGAKRYQVLREIARAACLVVPEQWPNPGPVVIAEAQLLGTPVVASNIGGIPEMEPTALCEPMYVPSFAAAILAVMSKPECYREGGYVVLPSMKRRYDPILIREQLMEVYRQCL